MLLYLLRMKKWIFCTKTTYLKDPKDLKSKKISLKLCSRAMIDHLAIFNDRSMQGSSFKQIELSQLLQNTENCT